MTWSLFTIYLLLYACSTVANIIYATKFVTLFICLSVCLFPYLCQFSIYVAEIV